MVPPENGENLAASIKGAQLTIIPPCGHLPMLEKPNEVAEAVLRSFG